MPERAAEKIGWRIYLCGFIIGMTPDPAAIFRPDAAGSGLGNPNLWL